MGRSAVLVLGLAGVVAVVACSGGANAQGTECATAEDCNGSDAATRAGRCGPELACVDGRCRAECLGTCEFDPANDFPTEQCVNGGICNRPITRRDGAPVDADRCTKRTVRCATTSDCPLQKPAADGDWTCDESGMCRFPGFVFPYD